MNEKSELSKLKLRVFEQLLGLVVFILVTIFTGIALYRKQWDEATFWVAVLIWIELSLRK